MYVIKNLPNVNDLTKIKFLKQKCLVLNQKLSFWI